MIKLSEEQIIDGQNEAYLKSGHNAYFGNGFNAGVDFALKQVNKLPIHIVSGCYAVFDDEDNIIQLYQTEEKANKGLLEFQNSHPHTEFYVDTIRIN